MFQDIEKAWLTDCSFRSFLLHPSVTSHGLYSSASAVWERVLPPMLTDPGAVHSLVFGRTQASNGLASTAAGSPHVIFLSGVRGSGKTRALLDWVGNSATWVDCEDPLQSQPLAELSNWVSTTDYPRTLVLDEVTSLPNWIQVLEAVASALPDTVIIATSSRFASPVEGLAPQHRVAKRAKAKFQTAFPYKLCEFVYQPSNQKQAAKGGGSLAGQATPSGSPFDRVFALDLRAHLPRLKRTMVLKLLKSVFEHCGDPIQKSELVGQLGISRSYLDDCLHALQQCGLLAYLPSYLKPKQGVRKAESDCEQVFLLCPSLVALALSNEEPDATMPAIARHRLFVWLHLRAVFPGGAFHFWRNPQGTALDFVFDYEPHSPAELCVGSAHSPLETAAVQCAISGQVEPNAFSTFRRQSPLGFNYVVLPNPAASHGQKLGGYMLGGFADALEAAAMTAGPERVKRQQQWLYLCHPVELLALFHFKEMPPVAKNETLVQLCMQAAQSLQPAEVATKKALTEADKRKGIRITPELNLEFLKHLFAEEYARIENDYPQLSPAEFVEHLISDKWWGGLQSRSDGQPTRYQEPPEDQAGTATRTE